jgi:hypothetical protein
MAKYSMTSVNKARQLQAAMAQVSITARERLSQMFIDLYMTPGAFADAQHRLGRAISLAEEEETVSTRGFPHSGITEVTYADLPYRLGGFKVVNDRINQVQQLLREIYGEIRTKITEWDLSVYLQEDFIMSGQPADLSKLSILYRMKNDNPGRYRDHRAYIYGILNTAISFERMRRWDPRLDPELMYWEPPTSSLEIWANPPKPQLRLVTYTQAYTTGWGWWQKTHYRTISQWIWYTPTPPAINALQRREIDRALTAKWTNWFPPYWQLFFWDPDINSLGGDDEASIAEAHLRNRESTWNSATSGSGSKFSLDRLKAAKRNRSGVTAEASLAAANAMNGKDGLLGKTVRGSGINVLGPILTGGPVGRYRDPRSLAAYLSNEPNTWNTPKIAPTPSVDHPINVRNRGINQMEGLRRVLNGWTTSFQVRREKDIQVLMWISLGSSRESALENIEEDHELITRRIERIGTDDDGSSYKYTQIEYGYYAWRTVRVPYWATVTRTGQFPNLSGTLQYLAPRQSTQSRVNTFLFWSWSFSARTSFIPGSYAILGDIVHDASFKSRFEKGHDRVPVIMMSAGKDFVATTILQRDSYLVPVMYYVVIRFRFWKWTWTRTYGPYWREEPRPCYTVHTGATSQLTSGIGHQRNYTLPALTIEGFVGNSAKAMRGFFFDIPARALDPSDNLFTSKWNEAGTGTTSGIALARAFTTGVWNSSGRVIGSPLPATISELHNRLQRVVTYLRRLQSLFNKIEGRVMCALIDQLPDEPRTRGIRQLARTRFADRGVYRIRQHLASLLATLIPLLEATRSLRTESTSSIAQVRQFIEVYSKIAILVEDRFLYNMLDSYLAILYEWRLIHIKQRLNKVDGTLIQLARIESIDIPTAEGAGVPPSIADALVGDVLQVVHKTTNISLAQRAEALRNKTQLPTERIHYVYVPVQYNSDGSIIRHAAGNYVLLSLEYLKDELKIDRVRFFITFEGAQAPPIVNNVMTGVNAQELQKIMSNPHLSTIEKICAARDTQDWWKIEIPSARRPLTENFETNIVLMIMPEDAEVENLLELIGEFKLSPILEHEGQEAGGTLAGLDATVEAYNSTSLKRNS